MTRKTMMNGGLSVACLGIGLALVAGCSSGGASPSEAPETLGSAPSAIISGTVSTSDQDAVILLAIYRGAQLQGTCTGTLVAPNLVLTARHCVSDTDRGALCTQNGRAIQEGVVRADSAPGDLLVYTGVDGVKKLNDPKLAAARGKQLVHETVSTLCNADLAFIVLDRSVQGRIATIRTTGGARVGEKLTAVGWGLTEAGALPAKRMQRANVAVGYIGPMVLDAQSSVGLGGSEFLVGEAFCSGDSGGPSFSSKGAVVGVVSRGGGGAQTPGNEASNCVGKDVLNFYTHLDSKQALVAKAFALAGATPRTEGDRPGVGVGEACTENLDCSSDACVKNKCERRCDDGTKCADAEVCTPFEDKKICTPAPSAPAPEPVTEEPAPAAAPALHTTTTTTSGCSAAPGTTTSGGLFLALGVAAIAGAARRRRR